MQILTFTQVKMLVWYFYQSTFIIINIPLFFFYRGFCYLESKQKLLLTSLRLLD